MEKEIEMISYANALELSQFFLTINNKAYSKHFVSYQINIDEFDEVEAHKFLFDYKVLAFRRKGENDYIVFKVSELEEIKAIISLWCCNLKDSILLKDTISIIKKEYSFYNWNYISVEILRKQLDDDTKRFIESFTSEMPIVLHSNLPENDRICYRISLEGDKNAD